MIRDSDDLRRPYAYIIPLLEFRMPSLRMLWRSSIILAPRSNQGRSISSEQINVGADQENQEKVREHESVGSFLKTEGQNKPQANTLSTPQKDSEKNRFNTEGGPK